VLIPAISLIALTLAKKWKNAVLSTNMAILKIEEVLVALVAVLFFS
jgi:hypothetical protein